MYTTIVVACLPDSSNNYVIQIEWKLLHLTTDGSVMDYTMTVAYNMSNM